MYRLTESPNFICRISDNAQIPKDERNVDYQEFLKWASNNEPDPPLQPFIASVTPRQAKLALLGAGLLDQVEAAVAASDKATQISWEYAIEFRRSEPLINDLGKQLGLTDEQIDQLFITASQL